MSEEIIRDTFRRSAEQAMVPDPAPATVAALADKVERASSVFQDAAIAGGTIALAYGVATVVNAFAGGQWGLFAALVGAGLSARALWHCWRNLRSVVRYW